VLGSPGEIVSGDLLRALIIGVSTRSRFSLTPTLFFFPARRKVPFPRRSGINVLLLSTLFSSYTFSLPHGSGGRPLRPPFRSRFSEVAGV